MQPHQQRVQASKAMVQEFIKKYYTYAEDDRATPHYIAEPEYWLSVIEIADAYRSLDHIREALHYDMSPDTVHKWYRDHYIENEPINLVNYHLQSTNNRV